ncbi:MAG: YidC/Oxa1 family membrane protein insertase, partial [Clostridia bacterium]|nr:YidC/Oxa1 family membrane protein insertase [Clostridia bacterium]
MDIFGTLIARPFGWVFWAILQIINNYGVALILFSLIVKIILYPLQYKGKKGMLAQQRLQPKIKDIEARYKNDRTAYNAALQELYSQNGISPMSGCLPTLLTFPIMIGLYRVIRQPLSYVFGVSSDGIKELISSLTASNAEAATDLAGMADGTAAVNEIAVMRFLDRASEYFIDMKVLGLDLTQTPSFKELSWLMILPILSGATALLMSILSQKMQAKTLGGSQTTD